MGTATYWTADLVRDLPDDGNRYECIDGELFATAGRSHLHQAAVGQFSLALFPYVKAMQLGYVLTSPLDAELDEGMIVQPDVLAFRLTPETVKGRMHGPDLLLVIEVLSPDTAHRDRGLKRRFYERIGVHEYWIVHPASRLVERWRPGMDASEFEDGELLWHPDGATRPLVIDLPALFDAIPEPFRTP